MLQLITLVNAQERTNQEVSVIQLIDNLKSIL